MPPASLHSHKTCPHSALVLFRHLAVNNYKYAFALSWLLFASHKCLSFPFFWHGVFYNDGVSLLCMFFTGQSSSVTFLRISGRSWAQGTSSRNLTNVTFRASESTLICSAACARPPLTKKRPRRKLRRRRCCSNTAMRSSMAGLKRCYDT